MCRYLRRHAHTVAAFAACAGKLYAGRQRLRSMYNTNRRSNDLYIFEQAAVETLLEQLAGRTPPDFWEEMSLPRLTGRPPVLLLDIVELHAVLLDYGVEAFSFEPKAKTVESLAAPDR
eukprot:3563633-Rhodomonas_salina.1